MLAIGVTVITGYKKIIYEIHQTREQTEQIQEKLNLPPPVPLGKLHIALRKRFILDQISQSDQEITLLIGDSIIEGANLSNLGGLPVLNAGMGGGSIIDVYELISGVAADGRRQAASGKR